MKYFKIITYSILLVLLTSCLIRNDDDSFNNPGPILSSAYEPIEMSREDFENSISLSSPIPIVNSGKIYIKDEAIYINEHLEGFHWYDNSNPSQPNLIRFIEVPGATDIAIKESVFYFQQATDLVSARFNDVEQTLEIVNRIRDIFSPMNESPDGYWFGAQEGSIIVGYKLL